MSYERLQQQITDLVEQYIADGVDHWPLMDQLIYLGPHLRSGQGAVGKVKPGSQPPGNLGADDLHKAILDAAQDWAYTLDGHRVARDQSLALLPDFAGRRLDRGTKEHTAILHGRTGLYASVSRWHLSVRIFLGYERPADRYPSAECPHCHYRDKRGAGSIRARETMAFCANPDCRDEHDRRHEWNRIVLEDFVRDALLRGRLMCSP